MKHAITLIPALLLAPLAVLHATERLLSWYCAKYGAKGYEFWGINVKDDIKAGVRSPLLTF